MLSDVAGTSGRPELSDNLAAGGSLPDYIRARPKATLGERFSHTSLHRWGTVERFHKNSSCASCWLLLFSLFNEFFDAGSE